MREVLPAVWFPHPPERDRDKEEHDDEIHRPRHHAQTLGPRADNVKDIAYCESGAPGALGPEEYTPRVSVIIYM